MIPAATTGMNKGLSDAELAQRVAAGEDAAFTLLMRRYNRPLYRTARSIVKDDAEAEDVLQDAYMLAYRGIKKFRGDAKLLTWLTRIVVNEAIARARKSNRRAEVIRMDGDTEWDDSRPEAQMNDAQPEQPERAAMRAQARDLLERKIDQLPDAFRTVFVLRAVEEMSIEEIADSLGIPEATIRTRFFRARSLLREALSREIDFAFEEVFAFAGARCDRIVARMMGHLEHLRAADT